MTPDLLFRIGCQLAGISWLALIFAGRYKIVPQFFCAILVPGLLGLTYTVLIATHWAHHPGGYASLPQVTQLFTDQWLLTAGWLHYLAFDLFVGAWQVREAQRSQIAHWRVVPCLISTFLFGPIGYLLFLALRAITRPNRESMLAH